VAKLTPQQTLELITLARNIEWFYQLEDYTKEQLKQLLKAVQQAESELLGRIDLYASSLPEWSEDRALLILDNLSNLTLGIRYVLEQGITNIAATSGAASFLMANDIASFGGRISGFNQVSLTAEQLRGLLVETPIGGNLLNEWVQNNYAKVAEDIREEFISGMLQGDSYPQFVQRLTSGFDMARGDAVSLSRTYVHSVNAYAHEEVYAANPDIIKGVRWTATIESGFKRSGHGVCPRCALLDGTVYRLDQPRPPIPLHRNCRCLYLPVLVSWKELGLDIPELEEVYRPTTIREDKSIGVGGRRTIKEVGFEQGDYRDFYLKQSRTFQNNVLGPRRASLLESGKVKWEDLIDHETGRLFTLEQLENK